MLNKTSECYQTRKEENELPKLIFIHSGYKVTIARDEAEVRDALELRFKVFRNDLWNNKSLPDAETLETDQYDSQCFHLIVRHSQTGIVVGTYRLQSWEMAQAGIGFYAATQFNINSMPEPILKQSIEIGRGCIHPDHRNGRVLFMLWKGLAASLIYMNKTTLFGCCSLFSNSQDEGLLLMNDLEEKKYVARGLSVSAKDGYKCFPSNNFDIPIVTPEIPLLFQKYLDFGAKVCSEPAIDREFGSIDYLVMLHFHQMDDNIYRFFTRDLLLQVG
jgi:putative hemolysin